MSLPFGEWRRAAHKCADMVYTRLTGEGPYFDSRVVYVSETGPKGKRVKRLALMDQDGFNGRFLTNGQTIVLTPTLSRDQRRIAYLSYLDKKPTIYVYDIASGRQTKLVTDVSLAFAPRFSPNGQWILFSMAQNGNTDLYRIPSGGGQWQRLTDSPGIDTGGSYSPDGVEDRVRKRPVGRAAALCDERRRIEPAAHQLRQRPLRDAGVEPARRPDRLHQDRRRLPCRDHVARRAAARRC